jgi:hypothetical protein
MQVTAFIGFCFNESGLYEKQFPAKRILEIYMDEGNCQSPNKIYASGLSAGWDRDQERNTPNRFLLPQGMQGSGLEAAQGSMFSSIQPGASICFAASAIEIDDLRLTIEKSR